MGGGLHPKLLEPLTPGFRVVNSIGNCFFYIFVRTDDRTRHAILEIEKVVLLDNGDYTCKVSNALGKAQAKLRLRGRFCCEPNCLHVL